MLFHPLLHATWQPTRQWLSDLDPSTLFWSRICAHDPARRLRSEVLAGLCESGRRNDDSAQHQRDSECCSSRTGLIALDRRWPDGHYICEEQTRLTLKKRLYIRCRRGFRWSSRRPDHLASGWIFCCRPSVRVHHCQVNHSTAADLDVLLITPAEGRGTNPPTPRPLYACVG